MDERLRQVAAHLVLGRIVLLRVQNGGPARRPGPLPPGAGFDPLLLLTGGHRHKEATQGEGTFGFGVRPHSTTPVSVTHRLRQIKELGS